MKTKKRKAVINQSYDKLWNYVRYIIRREDFIEKILGLKKKHGIPDECYSVENNWDVFVKFSNDDQDYLQPIIKDLNNILSEYGLCATYWEDIFTYYILFGEIKEFEPCSVRGLIIMTFSKNNNADKNEAFPISLQISPYASKRDMLDYIEKEYDMIEAYQKFHRKDNIKIGKFKSKDKKTQAIHDFLYYNRETPRKILCEQVADLFNEILDEGNVGKLISREVHLRQEV